MVGLACLKHALARHSNMEGANAQVGAYPGGPDRSSQVSKLICSAPNRLHLCPKGFQSFLHEQPQQELFAGLTWNCGICPDYTSAF